MDSELLDDGSHASIRASEHCRFPILKLTHPNAQSLALIEHEFNILTDLNSLGLPVSEVDTQPIVDGGRICGYQMKTLTKLRPGLQKALISCISAHGKIIFRYR